MFENPELWDVIVVGAGPAGLSAALVLGRCRRSVLLFDDGRPRNAASRHAHGFFTRDGAAPSALRSMGREQLAPYHVVIRDERVEAAARRDDGFEVRSGSGRFRARKLLLATGIVDRLPPLSGIEPLYGRSVFHCPTCDGWEVRDRALAVHGTSSDAVELALGLTVFSSDVALCTDGWSALSERDHLQLRAHAIALRMEPILRLEGEEGRLRAIVFRSGETLSRQALFFSAGTDQRSPLAAQLGCVQAPCSAVVTDDREQATTDGVYVVGDASQDMHFIAIAVAEGVKAACAANRALRKESSRARATAYRRLHEPDAAQ